METKVLKDLIFHLENIPLSTVPYHSDVPGITRFFSEAFPVHMAVHQISRQDKVEENYTTLHKHDDFAEINLVLGNEDLKYRIGLENEEFIVGRNTGIWIPAGVRHSANLLYGEGYYIAIRMDVNSVLKARSLSPMFLAAEAPTNG